MVGRNGPVSIWTTALTGATTPSTSEVLIQISSWGRMQISRSGAAEVARVLSLGLGQVEAVSLPAAMSLQHVWQWRQPTSSWTAATAWSADWGKGIETHHLLDHICNIVFWFGICHQKDTCKLVNNQHGQGQKIYILFYIYI